jgi:hypothetical protein
MDTCRQYVDEPGRLSSSASGACAPGWRMLHAGRVSQMRCMCTQSEGTSASEDELHAGPHPFFPLCPLHWPAAAHTDDTDQGAGSTSTRTGDGQIGRCTT